MGFSRPEYWSGLPFPSPGDFPSPRIKPGSPSLQADSLPSEPPDLVIGHVYLHLLGKAVLCSESCPERQKGQGFFTGAQGSGKVSLMSPQLELSFCPGAASKHSILHSAMGFVSWREWRQQRLMTEKHWARDRHQSLVHIAGSGERITRKEQKNMIFFFKWALGPKILLSMVSLLCFLCDGPLVFPWAWCFYSGFYRPDVWVPPLKFWCGRAFP